MIFLRDSCYYEYQPKYINYIYNTLSLFSMDLQGSGSIQVIKLHDNLSGSPSIDVNWNGEAFRKMTCLRQLTITSINKFSRGPQYLPNSLRVLEWDGYPSWTLPQDFHPYNLAILKLTQSELRTLDRLSKVSTYNLH